MELIRYSRPKQTDLQCKHDIYWYCQRILHKKVRCKWNINPDDINLYLPDDKQKYRLQAIYEYIIKKYDKTNIHGRKSLIKETDDISLLSSFMNFYEILSMNINNDYIPQIYIMQYLNNHGYINSSDNEKIPENIKDINDEMIITLLPEAVTGIDELYNQFSLYAQKVLNIIDDAINDIKNG